MRLFCMHLILVITILVLISQNAASSEYANIRKSPAIAIGSPDSLQIYKNLTLSELKKYESMSGALRTISKFFGDNLKKASQYLNKARRSNSEDIEGIFLNGILYRFEGKFRESETLFKQVISKDDRYAAFGFPNVWLQLGFVYREMNEFDLAIDAFKQGTLINLNDTWPLIQLSMVFIELNRAEEASEAFYGGLNEIKDTINVDRLFIDVRDIASAREMLQWDSIQTIPEKLEFLKTFWKRRDPNPIDPVNQRLAEHYKRLNHARQSYSKPFKPWYDDRGVLYVRLGKPDRIYYGKPMSSIKDNESWFYDNIKADLFFDLIDMGGNYEIRSLFDAAERDSRVEDVVELFNERANYNSYYQRMALRIRTEADVRQERATDAFERGRSTTTDAIDRARFATGMLNTNTNLQDNLFNLTYANNQHFVFDVGAPHLPINCNFASFKAGKKNSRLEFYYAVPFDQLNFVPNISESNKFSTGIKLNLTLFDLKYDEIKRLDRDYDITAGGNEIASHFYVDQLDNEIPPGKYVAALEIRNNEKDRVGIYKFVVSVRDYSSDTLTVSDIEIAQYVDNTITKEKFVKPKSTLKVVPNPAAGILKTKPLTVYYEIYNLTLNNDGKSSYQISYSIKMAEGNQSFLSVIGGVFSNQKEASTSSITTKEGKSTAEKEYIGFDISELPTGVATLEIKVKDLNSSKESNSFINITIQEEEKKKEEQVQK